MTRNGNVTKGIQEINNKHNEFIKIVSKFSMVANQQVLNREEIADVIYEMTMYSLNHFRDEEDYMKKFEYSEYKQRHKEHNDFIKKTIAFGDRTMKGDYDIKDELLEYLQSWLVNHVRGTDKKLTDFPEKDGLKESQKALNVY